MTLHEALSRLLDGELDANDAAALQARIATEPDVARAWAAINRLPTALAALPDAEPPAVRVPGRAALDRGGMASGASAFRRTPGPAVWVAVALAASLAVATLLPRDRPEIVLGGGVSMIAGDVDVLVGDLVIRVHGKSEISVEPLAGRVRDPGSEVNMDRSHLLAAFVGAAVSLTVDQGTAIVHAPGKEPVTVTTGQTRTIGKPVKVAPTPTWPGENRRITELEHELAGLKLQHAFAEGQLNSVNGAPQEFPADLPPAYGPAEFERNVRAGLRGVPGVDLLSMNCEEYPCIAILRTSDTGDDWGKKLGELGVSIKEGAYGEDAAIHEDSELLHGPNGDVRVMAFSTAPAGGEDENVSTRRAYRVAELLNAIGDREE